MLRNAKNTVLLFYRVSVPNKRFLGTIGRHYTRQFDILVAEHAGQGVLVVPNVLFPRKIEIVLLLVVRLFFFAGEGPGLSDTLSEPLSVSGDDSLCSVAMVVVLMAMVDWY